MLQNAREDGKAIGVKNYRRASKKTLRELGLDGRDSMESLMRKLSPEQRAQLRRLLR